MALAGGIGACCAVSVLDLGDLVSIGSTEQGHSPAIPDDGRGKLVIIVIAHLPRVPKDNSLSSNPRYRFKWTGGLL